MLATPSSLPSSAATASASSVLHRRKFFRRSSLFPQIRLPRSICAFYAASPAERERERAGSYYHYYSRSYMGNGRAAEAAVAAPAVAGTLYDVLGLSAGATTQEIKAAFRRLARECHPDVVAADRKGASADEFMRIHAAYATLSDPGKRAEYDRRVITATPRRRPPFRCASGSSPAPPSVHYYSSPASFNSSSSSGFSRRTWETDQCW